MRRSPFLFLLTPLWLQSLSWAQTSPSKPVPRPAASATPAPFHSSSAPAVSAARSRPQPAKPANDSISLPEPGETIDLIINKNEKKRIPGLEWDTLSPKVEKGTFEGASTTLIRLKGRLLYSPDGKKPGSERYGKYDQGVRLYYQQSKPKRAVIAPKDGSFEIIAPFAIRAGQIPILLKAVDEFGISYSDVIYLRRRVDASKLSKRFSLDVGAGVSYLSYNETYRGLKFAITELGITVKVNASYRLSKAFDIGGNAFMTAYPFVLDRSPAEIEPSRFLGINGRIGYRLPIYSPTASYFVMTGWYIWGQMVPGPLDRYTYGVSMLGGPQIFLTARFTTQRNRSWFLYTKFATISNIEQGIVSTTNREIAIGGGMLLSNPVEKRRWTGTLDLAHAHFADESRSFTLLSMTLGVSTTF